LASIGMGSVFKLKCRFSVGIGDYDKLKSSGLVGF
jgi:hypothetical protein